MGNTCTSTKLMHTNYRRLEIFVVNKLCRAAALWMKSFGAYIYHYVSVKVVSLLFKTANLMVDHWVLQVQWYWGMYRNWNKNSGMFRQMPEHKVFVWTFSDFIQPAICIQAQLCVHSWCVHTMGNIDHNATKQLVSSMCEVAPRQDIVRWLNTCLAFH